MWNKAKIGRSWTKRFFNEAVSVMCFNIYIASVLVTLLKSYRSHYCVCK